MRPLNSAIAVLVMRARDRINQLTNWELLKHWEYYQYIVGVLESPMQTLEGPMYTKRQVIRLVDFVRGATSARSIPNSEVAKEYSRMGFVDYKGVKVDMKDPKGMKC